MKDTILQAVDYIYNQDDSIFDKETREYFKMILQQHLQEQLKKKHLKSLN